MNEASKQIKQEELLNLLLLGIKTIRELSERVNLSTSTVRKYISEEGFLDSLHHLSVSVWEDVVKELKCERKSLKDRLTEASDKALGKLEELLESAQEGIALKAADSILDRNSESARNRKVEGNMQGRFALDPVLLMHAAATAQELEEMQKPKALPSFSTDDSKPHAE